MRIKSFNFNSNKQNLKIEKINFDDLNLLVGASGVGKTRILKALDLICDVAKDVDRKLDDVEWSINFFHLDKQYIWELKSSALVEDTFSNELGKSEILYERLSRLDHNDEIEILNRVGTDSTLNQDKLHKLKKTESAISLLSEEESIAPVREAFKHFVYNETPQQYVVSVPFNPSKVAIRFDDSEEDIKSFKEDLVNTPTVIKAYFLQKLVPELFNEIKDYYTNIFPRVQDIQISYDMDSRNSYKVYFEIKESNIDEWIPQKDISSGMLRTLNYLVEILVAPNDSVIVIDEFENNLGINCMSALTDFILDKLPGLQFILTSHHPYIINNIPWKTWQIVSKNGNSVNAVKAIEIPELNTASSLDKFTQLIDLLEYEDSIT